jgi:hypothetical protein
MGNLGLEDDDGLAVRSLEYARQLDDGGGFVPGDVALPHPCPRSAQDDAVGAYVAHLLPACAGAHGQHGDEYTNGAGYADDDGQDGATRCLTPDRFTTDRENIVG